MANARRRPNLIKLIGLQRDGGHQQRIKTIKQKQRNHANFMATLALLALLALTQNNRRLVLSIASNYSDKTQVGHQSLESANVIAEKTIDAEASERHYAASPAAKQLHKFAYDIGLLGERRTKKTNNSKASRTIVAVSSSPSPQRSSTTQACAEPQLFWPQLQANKLKQFDEDEPTIEETQKRHGLSANQTFTLVSSNEPHLNARVLLRNLAPQADDPQSFVGFSATNLADNEPPAAGAVASVTPIELQDHDEQQTKEAGQHFAAARQDRKVLQVSTRPAHKNHLLRPILLSSDVKVLSGLVVVNDAQLKAQQTNPNGAHRAQYSGPGASFQVETLTSNKLEVDKNNKDNFAPSNGDPSESNETDEQEQWNERRSIASSTFRRRTNSKRPISRPYGGLDEEAELEQEDKRISFVLNNGDGEQSEIRLPLSTSGHEQHFALVENTLDESTSSSNRMAQEALPQLAGWLQARPHRNHVNKPTGSARKPTRETLQLVAPIASRRTSQSTTRRPQLGAPLKLQLQMGAHWPESTGAEVASSASGAIRVTLGNGTRPLVVNRRGLITAAKRPSLSSAAVSSAPDRGHLQQASSDGPPARTRPSSSKTKTTQSTTPMTTTSASTTRPAYNPATLFASSQTSATLNPLESSNQFASNHQAIESGGPSNPFKLIVRQKKPTSTTPSYAGSSPEHSSQLEETLNRPVSSASSNFSSGLEFGSQSSWPPNRADVQQVAPNSSSALSSSTTMTSIELEQELSSSARPPTRTSTVAANFQHNPPYKQHLNQPNRIAGSEMGANIANETSIGAKRRPQLAAASRPALITNHEAPYESVAALEQFNSTLKRNSSLISESPHSTLQQQTIGGPVNRPASGLLSSAHLAAQTNSSRFKSKLQSLLIGKLLLKQPTITTPGGFQATQNSTGNDSMMSTSAMQATWTAAPPPLLSGTVANNVASMLAQKLSSLVRPAVYQQQPHNHYQAGGAPSSGLFGLRPPGSGSSQLALAANKLKQRVSPFGSLGPGHSALSTHASAINRRTTGVGSLLLSGLVYGLTVLPALMALTGVNPLGESSSASAAVEQARRPLAAMQRGERAGHSKSAKRPVSSAGQKQRQEASGASSALAYLIPLVSAPTSSDSLDEQFSPASFAHEAQSSALKSLYAPPPTVLETMPSEYLDDELAQARWHSTGSFGGREPKHRHRPNRDLGGSTSAWNGVPLAPETLAPMMSTTASAASSSSGDGTSPRPHFEHSSTAAPNDWSATVGGASQPSRQVAVQLAPPEMATFEQLAKGVQQQRQRQHSGVRSAQQDSLAQEGGANVLSLGLENSGGFTGDHRAALQQEQPIEQRQQLKLEPKKHAIANQLNTGIDTNAEQQSAPILSIGASGEPPSWWSSFGSSAPVSLESQADDGEQLALLGAFGPGALFANANSLAQPLAAFIGADNRQRHQVAAGQLAGHSQSPTNEQLADTKHSKGGQAAKSHFMLDSNTLRSGPQAALGGAAPAAAGQRPKVAAGSLSSSWLPPPFSQPGEGATTSGEWRAIGAPPPPQQPPRAAGGQRQPAQRHGAEHGGGGSGGAATDQSERVDFDAQGNSVSANGGAAKVHARAPPPPPNKRPAKKKKKRGSERGKHARPTTNIGRRGSSSTTTTRGPILFGAHDDELELQLAHSMAMGSRVLNERAPYDT